MQCTKSNRHVIASRYIPASFRKRQIELENLLPIVQKTKLDLIISGPIPHICKTVCCNFVTADNNHNEENDIQYQLSKVWMIEECELLRSKKKIKCETHFVETTSRGVSGRFVVSIPLKDSVHKLGTSKHPN